jgi:hypothetical protein
VVEVDTADLETMTALADQLCRMLADGGHRDDRLGQQWAMVQGYANLAADARGFDLPHDAEMILEALAL